MKPLPDWLILDEQRQLRRPETVEEYCDFMMREDARRVGSDQVGSFWISTVFLGVDLSIPFLRKGPPLCFETMVFREDEAHDRHRYSTWDDAEFGHKAIVRRYQHRQERKK